MKEVTKPTMYLGEDNSRHREQKIKSSKIHFSLRKKNVLDACKELQGSSCGLKQSKQRENNKRGSQRGERQYEGHGRTLWAIVQTLGFTLSEIGNHCQALITGSVMI